MAILIGEFYDNLIKHGHLLCSNTGATKYLEIVSTDNVSNPLIQQTKTQFLNSFIISL